MFCAFKLSFKSNAFLTIGPKVKKQISLPEEIFLIFPNFHLFLQFFVKLFSPDFPILR